MRVLPIDLRKSGFDLHQVLRDGAVALYRQTKPGTSIEALEVIKIRKQGQRTFNGRTMEAQELYPSALDWGMRGWTFQTKAEAMAKFREIHKEDL